MDNETEDSSPTPKEIICGCYDCVHGRAVARDFATPGGIAVLTIGMIVCELCGSKRCPHGTNHTNECTESNELGQPGSRYGGRI